MTDIRLDLSFDLFRDDRAVSAHVSAALDTLDVLKLASRPGSDK